MILSSHRAAFLLVKWNDRLRARILAMGERNPRSKLRAMKRRYFIAAAAVYFGVFLFSYLVLEILFMIFEAGPYTKLSALFVLFVITGVITDHIINQTLKDRWRREAPDILDSIKVPEPAYIPEGPVKTADSEKSEASTEVRRFHRTQHKELEQENQKTSEVLKKDSADGSEVKEHRRENENPKHSGKDERRFFSRRNRKPEEPAPAGESENAKPHSAEPPAWMKGLSEMDTVEFDDAVKNITTAPDSQERPACNDRKEDKARNDSDTGKKPHHFFRRRRKDDSAKNRKPAGSTHPQKQRTDEDRTHRKDDRKETRQRNSSSESVKAEKPAEKASSWMGKLEEMDTVEITEAMNRISSTVSGSETKPDTHSDSRGRNDRNKRRRKQRDKQS